MIGMDEGEDVCQDWSGYPFDEHRRGSYGFCLRCGAEMDDEEGI